MLINQGGGSFGTAITVQTSLNQVTGRSFFVGDLNRDGIKDIAVGTLNSANAEVFLANSSTSVGTNKIETISGLSIATISQARTTLDAIDPLMNRLTTFTSSIGASLSRMTTATKNLETSREQKSISAARITDVDVAQESAALVRSQILQNVAAAILAQANNQPALALQLLKR